MALEHSDFDQDSQQPKQPLSPEQQAHNEQELLLKEQEKADTEKANELLDSLDGKRQELLAKVIEGTRAGLDAFRNSIENRLQFQEGVRAIIADIRNSLRELKNMMTSRSEVSEMIVSNDKFKNTVDISEQIANARIDSIDSVSQLSPEQRMQILPALQSGEPLDPGVHAMLATAGKNQSIAHVESLTNRLPPFLQRLAA